MKKIKRLVDGVMVVVEVAADYVLQAGEEDVAEVVTQQEEEAKRKAEEEKRITTARKEEKDKQQGAIEREKEQRKKTQSDLETLQTRFNDLEQERRDAELEGMKPGERDAVVLRDMETRLRASEQQAAQTKIQYEAQLRATELAAYRERAIREYGVNIFPEMVMGDSEEAIDASAERAHQAYNTQMAQIRTQVETELAARVSAPVPVAGAVPTVVVPNPAQVATPAAQASFPTPTSAQPVAQEELPNDLGALTTEEAVRSGKWGGEMRAQILAQLRSSGGGSVNLGSNPRHMNTAPPQHTEMPQGVTQPQGSPTGPVAHPGAVQPAPVPPVAPQPQVAQPGQPTAQQAAAAAVQRTHAGTNPAMSGTPGAAESLAQATAHANGGTPQTAFAQRFPATPPVTQN